MQKKISKAQRMEYETETGTSHGTGYVWVKGYHKKDGTYVRNYDRRK